MANYYSTPKRSMLLGIILSFILFISITMIKPSLIPGWKANVSGFYVSLLYSRFVQWFCLLLVFLYAKKVERQDFMLWKTNRYKIPALLLHILLLYITVIVIVIPVQILIKLSGLHEESKQLTHLVKVFVGYPLMVPLVCMTAGIVEEYFFRGYLQPRLELLTKSPFAGILISAVLFGAVHCGYGTLQNIVVPFVIGLVFAAYYWKYRNIYTLIICHTLIDLISVYAMVNK